MTEVQLLDITTISLCMLLLGGAAGASMKAAAEQRRRSMLIRYIQAGDAQAPFGIKM
jgi:hypothetical protein